MTHFHTSDPPPVPTGPKALPWLDRPLVIDDLTVSGGDRDTWAADIGAVPMDRLRALYPPVLITTWLNAGALLRIDAIDAVPAWTLIPLPTSVDDVQPLAPHPLVAACSRWLHRGPHLDGADLLARTQFTLDHWCRPSPVFDGVTPREALHLSVSPSHMFFAAWLTSGCDRLLPPQYRPHDNEGQFDA